MTTTERQPIHPGIVLWEDVIKPLGLSITEAARRLRLTTRKLGVILHGRAPITPAVALRVGQVTRTSPESWLIMQNNYDLWKSRQQESLAALTCWDTDLDAVGDRD